MENKLPPAVQKSDEEIINRIHFIRGQKVMLDRDLAEMYDVEVRTLNQSVKRNISRFPEDFMFQLSEAEWKTLISQIVISKTEGRGGTRKFPYAFTEAGVAQLSSVLRSETAIQVNIQIIRVYTKMRQLLSENKELWQRVESIERRIDKKDEEVQAIFKLLKKFLIQEEKPRTKIGFAIQPKQKKK